MEVYLDVLILENFIMNYIILYTTSVFLKSKRHLLRLAVGSCIGAVYTVISLLITATLSSGFIFLGKICLSLLIISVSFNPRNIREFIKTLITFYVVTFIFAGSAFALIMFGGLGNIAPDGTMYLEWNFPVNYIFMTAFTGIILFNLFRRYIKERSRSDDCFVSLYIVFDGNGKWIPALVDTGNELKDPISGTPVVIVEAEAISTLFPEILNKYFKEKGINEIMHIDVALIESGWINRFRIVPYCSLGCDKGVLPGFKPDYIEIDEKGHDKKDIQDVIICLYDKKLSENKKYSALLAPDLVA